MNTAKAGKFCEKTTLTPKIEDIKTPKSDSNHSQKSNSKGCQHKWHEIVEIFFGSALKNY